MMQLLGSCGAITSLRTGEGLGIIIWRWEHSMGYKFILGYIYKYSYQWWGPVGVSYSSLQFTPALASSQLHLINNCSRFPEFCHVSEWWLASTVRACLACYMIHSRPKLHTLHLQQWCSYKLKSFHDTWSVCGPYTSYVCCIHQWMSAQIRTLYVQYSRYFYYIALYS